jgi:hypothetical protein
LFCNLQTNPIFFDFREIPAYFLSFSADLERKIEGIVCLFAYL